MHSDAIWNVKYQDFILNKVISCGYNDAWFAKNHVLAKKSKAPTACLQNDKTIVYFDLKKISDELKGGPRSRPPPLNSPLKRMKTIY